MRSIFGGAEYDPQTIFVRPLISRASGSAMLAGIDDGLFVLGAVSAPKPVAAVVIAVGSRLLALSRTLYRYSNKTRLTKKRLQRGGDDGARRRGAVVICTQMRNQQGPFAGFLI